MKRIYSDKEMAYFDLKSPKINLVYLHGDINHAEHMVVSSFDYQNFADSHPIMQDRIKPLLQEYTFLFIGYSVNDSNLRAIFDHFRMTYKEDAQRHFIALADADIVKQVELRSRFGIEPIILKHYKELTLFLEKLVHAYKSPGEFEAHIKEEVPDDFASPESIEEIIKARSGKIFEQKRFQIPVDFKPKKPFNVPAEDPHFTGRETEIGLL